MRNLLVFLPDEAFPLILVLLAVAVVVGLARPRLLLGFLLLLMLLPVIGPLFDAFLTAVPWWLVVLVVGGLLMWVVRAALSVLVGREAAAHVVGALVAEAIKAVFKLLFLPVRVIGWLLRRRHA
jgi:hypothetical protein